MIALGKERYYLLEASYTGLASIGSCGQSYGMKIQLFLGVKEIDGHDYIRLSFMSDLLLGYLRMYRA